MKSSTFIVAAATAISVFGAASSALAQGTSTEAGQPQQTGSQNGVQAQPQTAQINQGSSSRPSTDSSMNRAGESGTTGTTGTNGTVNRSNARTSDAGSDTTERVARADRN